MAAKADEALQDKIIYGEEEGERKRFYRVELRQSQLLELCSNGSCADAAGGVCSYSTGRAASLVAARMMLHT
jgi:hypothetical protein